MRKENILGWGNIRTFDFCALEEAEEGKKSVKFLPWKFAILLKHQQLKSLICDSFRAANQIYLYMTIHTWTLRGNTTVGCLSWKDFFFVIIFTTYIYFYRRFCLFLLFSRKANWEKLTLLSSPGKVIKGFDSLV